MQPVTYIYMAGSYLPIGIMQIPQLFRLDCILDKIGGIFLFLLSDERKLDSS